MAQVRELGVEQCGSAAAIQQQIDEVAASGGTVVLPELDLVLDRGLQLRSGVELRGQGEGTLLRKAAGRTYPFSGYHNYGMTDAPLLSTEGLEPGMTVSLLDDKRGGFYSTLARITWVDGNWVGLDHGLEADLIAGDEPRLVTTFPLIFALVAQDVAVRDLTLDGNRDENDHAMDGCRGAAVYALRSDGFTVTGVRERGFNGEGLGFQMCSRVRIRETVVAGNTGNGLHPGAGSTDALFENCVSEDNGNCGFFFCVRANHITVRGCTFRRNHGPGVSIGTRDCFNLLEDCDVTDNGGPGVLARAAPAPTEVHSCAVRACRLRGNARDTGRGQIEIQADAHDLVLEANEIDAGEGADIGVVTDAGTAGVHLSGNRVTGCRAETDGDGFSNARPDIHCGRDTVGPRHFRHLAETPGAVCDAGTARNLVHWPGANRRVRPLSAVRWPP